MFFTPRICLSIWIVIPSVLCVIKISFFCIFLCFILAAYNKSPTKKKHFCKNRKAASRVVDGVIFLFSSLRPGIHTSCYATCAGQEAQLWDPNRTLLLVQGEHDPRLHLHHQVACWVPGILLIWNTNQLTDAPSQSSTVEPFKL